jgi:hypothetical protein
MKQIAFAAALFAAMCAITATGITAQPLAGASVPAAPAQPR